MIDWAQQIRQSAERRDNSLVFRAAVQAQAALNRTRDRWGERGMPWELRADGPAPEEDWVWFGRAVASCCTARDDLATIPSLLAFRIREESPMEAGMRLDRFRVAWELPPNHAVRWLEPSGEPYLARPAEILLDFAFRGWEDEVEERWRDEPAPRRRLLGRRRRQRERRNAAHRAVNGARLDLFVQLIEAAYAPEPLFTERSAALEPAHRLEAYTAVASHRDHLLAATDLTSFLADGRFERSATELLSRLARDAVPPDEALG